MLLKRLNLAVLLLTFCQISNILADDTPVKCYKCDSGTNDNCIKNVTAIATIDADAGGKGCFTQIDGAKVTRDKVTDQTEGANIKICTTNECNNNNICKNCISSTDKNCAQTNSVDAQNEICPAAGTKCLTIIKDKITSRRCATDEDLKTCEGPLCTSCTAGNCNTGIFPTDRRRCYQCKIDESSCVNVIENSQTQTSLPCELYVKNDTCYTLGTAVDKMARGCVSDSTNNNCGTTPSNECSICGEDSCNRKMYKNAQKLECITCNSKDTPDCLWAQSANDAHSCTNQIIYNQKEQCYTQIKENVVYRGCFYDRNTTLLGADCGENNNCSTCADQSGCNNKDSGEFTCIRCRSDDSPTCRKGGDNMVGEKCVNPVTKDNDKCYYGKFNNIAIRGCLVDVDEQMLVVCTDPKNKQCEICDGKDCNTKEISGAATITISTVLLSIVTLVAMWH